MEKPVTTRREVLKYAGLGVGAATASAFCRDAESPEQSERSACANQAGANGNYRTAAERLAAGPEIAWSKAAKNAAQADVTVDPGKTAQTILGFGAAFTDAARYTLASG
jgi:hypothetical protein